MAEIRIQFSCSGTLLPANHTPLVYGRFKGTVGWDIVTGEKLLVFHRLPRAKIEPGRDKPLYYMAVKANLYSKKVQVGKDQEKAQSERDSHSKNRGGKKPN